MRRGRLEILSIDIQPLFDCLSSLSDNLSGIGHKSSGRRERERERITDPSRTVEADGGTKSLSLVFLNIIIIQKHNEVAEGHPGWR